MGILRKPRGAFVGSPDGGVRGYVGAIQLEFIASGGEAQNGFQQQSELVSFPNSMDLGELWLLPLDGASGATWA